MATNNVTVRISEENKGSAYYVYFGKDINNLASFDKRYILDSSTYRQTFPNLISNSWYKLDELNLDTTDSYIGVKVKTDESTMISFIFSNQLLEDESNQYKYAIIVDESVVLRSELMNNWMYIVDLSTTVSTGSLVNTNRSYIIDIILTSSENIENSSAEDIIISYHEIDSNAHQADLAYFSSDKTASSIISERLWTLNNSMTYEKMNGLITTKSYTHRVKYVGTPLTVNFNNYAFVQSECVDRMCRESAIEVLEYYKEKLGEL